MPPPSSSSSDDDDDANEAAKKIIPDGTKNDELEDYVVDGILLATCYRDTQEQLRWFYRPMYHGYRLEETAHENMIPVTHFDDNSKVLVRYFWQSRGYVLDEGEVQPPVAELDTTVYVSPSLLKYWCINALARYKIELQLIEDRKAVVELDREERRRKKWPIPVDMKRERQLLRASQADYEELIKDTRERIQQADVSLLSSKLGKWKEVNEEKASPNKIFDIYIRTNNKETTVLQWSPQINAKAAKRIYRDIWAAALVDTTANNASGTGNDPSADADEAQKGKKKKKKLVLSPEPESPPQQASGSGSRGATPSRSHNRGKKRGESLFAPEGNASDEEEQEEEVVVVRSQQASTSKAVTPPPPRRHKPRWETGTGDGGGDGGGSGGNDGLEANGLLGDPSAAFRSDPTPSIPPTASEAGSTSSQGRKIVLKKQKPTKKKKKGADVVDPPQPHPNDDGPSQARKSPPTVPSTVSPANLEDEEVFLNQQEPREPKQQPPTNPSVSAPEPPNIPETTAAVATPVDSTEDESARERSLWGTPEPEDGLPNVAVTSNDASDASGVELLLSPPLSEPNGSAEVEMTTPNEAPTVASSTTIRMNGKSQQERPQDATGTVRPSATAAAVVPPPAQMSAAPLPPSLVSTQPPRPPTAPAGSPSSAAAPPPPRTLPQERAVPTAPSAPSALPANRTMPSQQHQPGPPAAPTVVGARPAAPPVSPTTTLREIRPTPPAPSASLTLSTQHNAPSHNQQPLPTSAPQPTRPAPTTPTLPQNPAPPTAPPALKPSAPSTLSTPSTGPSTSSAPVAPTSQAAPRPNGTTTKISPGAGPSNHLPGLSASSREPPQFTLFIRPAVGVEQKVAHVQFTDRLAAPHGPDRNELPMSQPIGNKVTLGAPLSEEAALTFTANQVRYFGLLRATTPGEQVGLTQLATFIGQGKTLLAPLWGGAALVLYPRNGTVATKLRPPGRLGQGIWDVISTVCYDLCPPELLALGFDASFFASLNGKRVAVIQGIHGVAIQRACRQAGAQARLVDGPDGSAIDVCLVETVAADQIARDRQKVRLLHSWIERGASEQGAVCWQYTIKDAASRSNSKPKLVRIWRLHGAWFSFSPNLVTRDPDSFIAAVRILQELKAKFDGAAGWTGYVLPAFVTLLERMRNDRSGHALPRGAIDCMQELAIGQSIQVLQRFPGKETFEEQGLRREIRNKLSDRPPTWSALCDICNSSVPASPDAMFVEQKLKEAKQRAIRPPLVDAIPLGSHTAAERAALNRRPTRTWPIEYKDTRQLVVEAIQVRDLAHYWDLDKNDTFRRVIYVGAEVSPLAQIANNDDGGPSAFLRSIEAETVTLMTTGEFIDLIGRLIAQENPPKLILQR